MTLDREFNEESTRDGRDGGVSPLEIVA